MEITELFDDVRARIPAAPTPLVEMAARRALSEFFRKSTAWRQRIQSISIEAGRARYEMSASAPICATTKLCILETQAPIRLRTEDQMDEMEPAWRLATGLLPTHAIQDSPSTLLLYPIPQEAGKHLDIEVAVYPNAETTEIPNWIGEMYRDALIDGILGVLYAMPDQKWANANLAQAMTDELRAAARAARIRVEKSNTRAPQVARFTNFDEL